MKGLKKVTITINTENDTFMPYANDEVCRILRHIEDRIRNNAIPSIILDINGNKVGTIESEY